MPDARNPKDIFSIQLIIDNAEEVPKRDEGEGERGDERGAGGGGGGDGGVPTGGLPVPWSDDALAVAFANDHRGDLVYIASAKEWRVWDGARWANDDIQEVLARARLICRKAANQLDNRKKASDISSARTIGNVARLAGTDHGHARRMADFDCDPWLLNTPAGVVDLRRAKIGLHDPGLHMSKVTNAPGVGDACPTWWRYLKEVTGGDIEVEAYLRRIVGYCLTGLIDEHALFFLHGPGANGKTVFVNTVAGMLGDYALTAPMDVFTVSKGERHPTELAMLCGARLVTASEVEAGRRWDEARLKAITGGDPITARFIRGDFFTFRPNFKLCFAGNYRPQIRSVDEAMRRRVNIVPFMVRIARPDKDLPGKLRAEWDGILGWAVQGCLEWQRQGLAPPPAVREATANYFEAEDAIGKWLAERCEQGPDVTAYTRDLFRDWQAWCQQAGEYVGSERRLAQRLEERAFKRWRHPVTRARGFQGIVPLHASRELEFNTPRPVPAPQPPPTEPEDEWQF